MFHAGACCVFKTVFCTHRHPASTNPAHPVSVPIRHPSDKSFAVTSFETSQMQQYTRYIRVIPTRVACGLFSWSMAAGLLALPSRQFALTINHGPLFASHYFSFLSKRSGRRMPPAERSALYIIRTWYRVRIFKLWEIASNEGKMK